MSLKIHRIFLFCFCNFFVDEAVAVTLASGQTDYTTTADITSTSTGISSSLSGTSSSYNKIKNTFTITTSTNSGAYGIKSSGSYNQIINDVGAKILTTASSGRGISVASNSQVYNLGSIATQGTTSYGIYAGSGNNTISNSGSISTSNTTSYGIYLASDNNIVTNSGSINAQVYGIYSDSNSNQIYNNGTITTTKGSSAHGIFMSAGSSSNASASSYGVINNSGTINSNANGIYNKDNYTQITNSGAITTASGSSIYGIRNEGDNATIANSGTISSTNYAIYNSGTSAIINNSGTLYGGVMIGSGVLNILGGSISGTVDGASNSGSVAVSSGVSFNQTAAFSALNNLTIASNATLNSTASIAATNIVLDSGATLNLNSGSSIPGPIQADSNSHGTINISVADLSLTSFVGSSTNSLANVNILSNSVVTAYGNIYADKISLAGTLNFNSTSNSTIVGTVTGSGLGTFNIGSQNQTIDGNFTLNSGDILKVALKNGGAGSLAVTGLALINDGAKIGVTTSFDQGYIANGTSYQILSSSSFGSTTTTQISTSDISVNGSESNMSGLLEYTVSSVPDGLVLNVNHLSASQVTSNVNAQNIYQNLVDIGSGSSGKLLSFQEYLDSSTLLASQLTRTINQLAPQSTKAAIFTANNAVNSSLQILQNRLDKKRRYHDDAELKEGAWTQIFGGSAQQQQVASDDGYKSSLAGIAFGADHLISEDNRFGLAASLAKSSAKTIDSSKQNLIDTYQVSIYNSKNFERYFIDSMASIALNHFDSTRAIFASGADATAGYLGQNYALKVKAGTVKNLQNGFSFMPEIGMNFFRNDIAGYSEKGADELSLQVSRVTANFMEARFGSNFGYTTKIHELPEIRKMTALLKLSYGYSLINDAPVTKANFQGQSSSFNSQISNVDRGSFKAGTEIAFYQKDNATFALDYDFERKATYSGQLISFKVRQEF